MAGEEDKRIDFLTEDEIAALNEPGPNVDEAGPTPAPEEKVETQEPSPPEPGKTEEPATERKDEEPPKVEEPAPPIDGILTKDGKHFMPFGVLERERAEKAILKAELEELKRAKPAELSPVPPPPKEEKIELPKTVDFVAMAKKAYESEEGMAEVLQTLKSMVDEARSSATTAGVTAATIANIGVRYDGEMEVLKQANPWMTGDAELFAAQKRNEKLAKERIDPSDPSRYNDLIRITKGAIEETKQLLKVGASTFDPEKERAKIRKEEEEKAVKKIMQKFNITEAKIPATLSDVRNLSPEVLTRLDALESLDGVDFEIAYSKLSPTEREEFTKKHHEL